MANHPSAEKRNRQRAKRTDRNRAVKSAVRSQLKAARIAVAQSTGAGAEAAKADPKKSVLTAVKSLDRAASKGVIHKKAAARKKSRLARALHKASAAK